MEKFSLKSLSTRERPGKNLVVAETLPKILSQISSEETTADIEVRAMGVLSAVVYAKIP